MDFNMDGILNTAMQLVTTYGLRLVGALLVLIIGWPFIKTLVKIFDKQLKKRDVDETLRPFLGSMIGALLKVLLVISILSMLGVAMTSFIAVLGAAGLAVGLALSGTLQNFAGGVLILILRPFRKGDFVDAQGYTGTVSEIQIFHTVLKTPDNKTVILPNGPLSTGSLVNFSVEETRRVDLTVGIGYGDDADHAKKVIMGMVTSDDRVLTDPEPFIAVSELADSSVNFTVRLWVKKDDYFPVFFDMQERVYKIFPKENLNIPFPQMDVHVHNNS